MKHVIFIVPVFFLIACIYIGCGDEAVNNGGCTDKNTGDTSILRADEFGNELFGDTTDWCNGNPGGFHFYAAYPNPTTSSINARFYIPENDTIKLYIKDCTGKEHVYMNGFKMAGTHVFHIKDTLKEFQNTYQRLYITSKLYQPSAYCRFYGDIRFEEY